MRIDDPRVRRIIIRPETPRARLWAFRASQAVMRVIRRNITTEGDGSWAPLKCRRGKALSRRKMDWKRVKKEGGGHQVYAEPFWWTTHLEGREGKNAIKPRRAKVLRFMCGGQVVFARKVVIPRRDPRPTGDQMRRELTNGS